MNNNKKIFTISQKPSIEEIHTIRNLAYVAILADKTESLQIIVKLADMRDEKFVNQHLQIDKICTCLSFEKKQ